MISKKRWNKRGMLEFKPPIFKEVEVSDLGSMWLPYSDFSTGPNRKYLGKPDVVTLIYCPSAEISANQAGVFRERKEKMLQVVRLPIGYYSNAACSEILKLDS